MWFLLTFLFAAETPTSVGEAIRLALATGSANYQADTALLQQVTRQIPAAGPLHIAFKKIATLPGGECGRVQADYTLLKPNFVPTDGSDAVRWSVAFDICADGQPPQQQRGAAQ